MHTQFAMLYKWLEHPRIRALARILKPISDGCLRRREPIWKLYQTLPAGTSFLTVCDVCICSKMTWLFCCMDDQQSGRCTSREYHELYFEWRQDTHCMCQNCFFFFFWVCKLCRRNDEKLYGRVTEPPKWPWDTYIFSLCDFESSKPVEKLRMVRWRSWEWHSEHGHPSPLLTGSFTPRCSEHRGRFSPLRIHTATC